MLCPLCHASCPATPHIKINFTPSPLPHLLTLPGRWCCTGNANRIGRATFNDNGSEVQMFLLFRSPELVHSIHLKSSHRFLPTQVDPSNSRALRNSPFSPHCKNQTPAFFLKPTGFTVPAQRAQSLPTTSAPPFKNQTSTALQLKRSTKRRRRKRNGAILKLRTTPR